MADSLPSKGSFELFDHTADMGIRVTAPKRQDVPLIAAQGLYAAIGDIVPGDQSRVLTYAVTTDDPAVALRDFLSELLMLIERDRLMLTSINLKHFDQEGLAGELTLSTVNEERSEFQREVKAVTYHDLAIVEGPNQVEATFIVDI